MASSHLTLDLLYDLHIQRIQNLSTAHAHVQLSGLYYEVNRSYALFHAREYVSGISNKRHPNVQA